MKETIPSPVLWRVINVPKSMNMKCRRCNKDVTQGWTFKEAKEPIIAMWCDDCIYHLGEE